MGNSEMVEAIECLDANGFVVTRIDNYPIENMYYFIAEGITHGLINISKGEIRYLIGSQWLTQLYGQE